jgi:hypothetical protein
MSLTACDWYFWTVAALGGLFATRALWSVRSIKLLPPGRPGAGSTPTCTVVVAARDEQAGIEATVRGLLAQEGVDLRVVVVDDRSTDQTGTILRAVAATDPRLSVVRIDHLPAGWLGKCHALHAGATLAATEWLLFADGDVRLSPDTVARAVRRAQEDEADHLTLVPGVRGATLVGAAGHLLLNLSLARRAEATNRDCAVVHLGVGAFNLVRTSAYRALGGHAPLRMEVVDDLKLALLVKRAGGRSRAYFAPRDVDADWCASLLGLVRDLEKNHFAVTGYRLAPVLAGALVMALFWVGALVGPWAGTTAGLAAGLGLAALILPAAVAAVRLRTSVASAILVPLLLPLLGISLVNSTVRTLWRGGVRWRETFYPLAALRAGLVR